MLTVWASSQPREHPLTAGASNGHRIELVRRVESEPFEVVVALRVVGVGEDPDHVRVTPESIGILRWESSQPNELMLSLVSARPVMHQRPSIGSNQRSPGNRAKPWSAVASFAPFTMAVAAR